MTTLTIDLEDKLARHIEESLRGAMQVGIRLGGGTG